MEDVSVVLVETRNPLNIGAVGRAMANFGFPDLRLVDAYRVAVDEARGGPNADAVLLASRDFPTIADAIADADLVIGTSGESYRKAGIVIRRLDEAAAIVRATPGRTAILFGSEKFGLSNEAMSHCHWMVRIPTGDDVPSMNLGQAVAVTLYELIRESAQRLPRSESIAERMAPAAMLDFLTVRLYDVLQQSGFIHADNVEEKLRRLTRRMHLREDDAVMLLGMMRQILWRLSSENQKHDTSRNEL
jgi:TrmH family RNA methyltransferase